jgi:hypothetical protein
MATQSPRRGIEWVGGVVSMPAYVTGEGEPYRRETLLWMSPDGAILGHAVGRPGEVVAIAAQSLHDTIAHPMVGRPRPPERVRVASNDLAAALRAAVAGLEVVCAPTPELDEAFASMCESMSDPADVEQTYLSPDVGPEAMSAFFRAAARLFRAKPWTIVPGDDALLSVTIASLDVRDAAVSVIGQMKESHGFLVFSSLDDFEGYLDAADAMEHGEAPVTMPRHFVLSFERRADLGASLRLEIETHRWEVAGVSAYPWVVAIDPDLVARPGSAREVRIAEGISLALPRLLSEEKKALRAAWDGGPPVERSFTVPAHGGDLEVTLRAPFGRTAADSPFDLIADLHALAGDGEEIDDDARRALEDELVRRFAEWPEAKSLPDVGSCRIVMDFAASAFGATIATLRPRELREIVFEMIPRQASVDAAEASPIIDELRAFYSFLGRELGLKQARGCLAVLAGDAAERLEAALSDSRNFGMAKSLFMSGREAGFDMGSQEGIEAWLRAIEGQPLPASVRLPSPLASAASRPARGAARAEKDKRKAARKARKKNR